MRKTDQKIVSIRALISKLERDSDGCGPIWYRGQANKSWNLSPSLLRDPHSLAEEQTLIKRFKQNASMLLSRIPSNDFEWLFMMQHYGIPTRLLDWSESPLVALYFAIRESANEDGVLWALLPVELNRNANIEPDYSLEIPYFEDDVIRNYSPEVIASEKVSKLNPVAALTLRNNSRMQAQLSVFTINHRSDNMIENIGNSRHIWRYIIPKDSKSNIMGELELLGVGRFQLFPELSSIGDVIRGVK